MKKESQRQLKYHFLANDFPISIKPSIPASSGCQLTGIPYDNNSKPADFNASLIIPILSQCQS